MVYTNLSCQEGIYRPGILQSVPRQRPLADTHLHGLLSQVWQSGAAGDGLGYVDVKSHREEEWLTL